LQGGTAAAAVAAAVYWLYVCVVLLGAMHALLQLHVLLVHLTGDQAQPRRLLLIVQLTMPSPFPQQLLLLLLLLLQVRARWCCVL
jgi:hypothetical protein